MDKPRNRALENRFAAWYDVGRFVAGWLR